MKIVSLEVYLRQGVLSPMNFCITSKDDVKNYSRDQQVDLQALILIIVNNLTHSGMFAQKQLGGRIYKIADLLAQMRAQGVQINIEIQLQQINKKYIVDIIITHDTGDNPSTISMRFTSENLRMIGHYISNAVFQEAWSIPGDFDSQVLYVSVQDEKNKLILMDHDGENVQVIDTAAKLATPAISKDGLKIAYVKHVNFYPCLFLYDRITKQHQQLTPIGKNCYSPVFSNDGTYLIFSYSNNGSTSLYKMYLNNPKEFLPITQAKKWIDTAAAFTASGQEIVLISDRISKTPKPYIYGLNTGNIHNIPTKPGAYYDPACCINVFNEKVTQICLFKRKNSVATLVMLMLDEQFQLMQEKELWSGPRIFAPNWSINGTSVVFNTNAHIKRINVFTGHTETIKSYGQPKNPVMCMRPEQLTDIQFAFKPTVNI